MTLNEFYKTEYKLPDGARFLGVWNEGWILYFVFEYVNGAKLRASYWKKAELCLICVKDKVGSYFCLSDNVKTKEELAKMIEGFDYRRFDAKKEKRYTRPSNPAGGAGEHYKHDAVATAEIQSILERLNNI